MDENLAIEDIALLVLVLERSFQEVVWIEKWLQKYQKPWNFDNSLEIENNVWIILKKLLMFDKITSVFIFKRNFWWKTVNQSRNNEKFIYKTWQSTNKQFYYWYTTYIQNVFYSVD